jgi:hypothetical protein
LIILEKITAKNIGTFSSEKKNKKVLCNGARHDVHPSGMLSQMSKGLKAYQLTIGRHVQSSDIVEIFVATDREKIGSISDQEKYYEKWLDSLR